MTGTKKERAQNQDWYAVIEAETLRQLDAAEAAEVPAPEEVTDVP